MARIFISYSRVDEAMARRLAASLSDMGADVWIDVEDIPAGMKWSSAIQQGLDSGELLIVVISPESMASRNVEDEWQYYLDHNKPVVPVLLKPAKVHFQLNRLQYIDFHTQPYDIAINQLYAELRRKGLQLRAPDQPADTGKVPHFDNLSPEEIDRVLAELQARRQQFTQTAPTPVPQPQQTPPQRAANPQRRWLAGAAVAGVVVIALVGLVLMQGLGAQNQTPPPSPTSPQQPTQTTQVDLGNEDSDGDSLTDGFEGEVGTDPNNPDTDGDGLDDGAEMSQWGTDPLKPDTDDDGLSDAEEVGSCTDPTLRDTDFDGIDDQTETQQGSACVANTPTPAATRGLSADNPVTRNSDWTPIMRTFNGVEMVLVPVGSFVMGTSPRAIETFYQECEPYGNICRSSDLFRDESPVAEVAFDQPFWIDRYEVTNEQYGSQGAYGGVNLPRTDVTWRDAQNYCEARGARLPTEPEWEFAARGPDSLAWPFGNIFPGAIFNYCDASCTENWRDAVHDDGYAQLAPVGTFPENASWVGALDMAGNVWEWTSTIYTPTPGGGYTDPANRDASRTLKGGAWTWLIHEARGAARSPHTTGITASSYWGFRCARDFNRADIS